MLGLRGWRWLFLVEGLPALALGIALPWVLPRTPADARFLAPEQQRWVARRVAEGDATTAATFGGTHPARDWKVWYWGIATASFNCAMYGLLFCASHRRPASCPQVELADGRWAQGFRSSCRPSLAP